MRIFNRLSLPILFLMWTAYYYAKRSVAGLATTTDMVVCGAVTLLSIVLLATRCISLWKEYRRTRA